MAPRLRVALATFGSVLLAALPAAASAAGALSQGFKINDPTLPAGSLVSLLPSAQGTVQAASSNQTAQLMGVIADKPLVELGGGATQVQVVVSGLTNVLVSDINGDIRTGDKVTASPIKGVGMKAQTSTEVVGTAQSNLKDAATTSHTITDRQGKTRQVHIGSIQLQVNISYYAVSQGAISSLVPSFLLSAGTAIAGKDVSPVRALLGFSCLLVGFIIAAIILQAAVRAGIISLGRNPLAHNVLRRSLMDTLLTTLGLLVLTTVIFYLILTA